jgi:aminoglycoside phosphotransferase (APT) family kinase protein
MSQSRIFRVSGPRGSAIVKSGARPAEARFYRTVMPVLKDFGIAIPQLIWLGSEDDTVWWIALEDVAQPLPRERWDADQEVLAMLKRLHATPPSWLPAGLDGFFCPQWTQAMDEATLRYFAVQATGLAELLRRIRGDYQYLFSMGCLISGDPNPTNWGLREDGSVVLYDWERFGRGAPALDLAITIPGLGDEGAFKRVAAAYLRAGGGSDAGAIPERIENFPSTVGALAKEIAAAKVWSVVEFAGMVVDDAVSVTPRIHTLLSEFPGWVGSLPL